MHALIHENTTLTLIEAFLAEPKALIIAEPWATKICTGQKDWEMRSRNVKHRGLFAIAQKGTGLLIGVAELYDCSHELSDQERIDNAHHHQVDADAFKTPGFDKYRIAWKLRNMQQFAQPIRFAPRNGAVSWINLTQEEAESIIAQVVPLSETLMTPPKPQPKPALHRFIPPESPAKAPPKTVREPIPTVSVTTTASTPTGSSIPPQYQSLRVPIAKDGTVFSPQKCNKNGKYRVGPKGEEVVFHNFVEALQHLEKLPAAYWRRPNPKGNWGGVKAKDWVRLSDHWQ